MVGLILKPPGAKGRLLAGVLKRREEESGYIPRDVFFCGEAPPRSTSSLFWEKISACRAIQAGERVNWRVGGEQCNRLLGGGDAVKFHTLCSVEHFCLQECSTRWGV